ncbi:hypothetical protein ACYOEI_14615, partial [Singulisphaera rosea]
MNQSDASSLQCDTHPGPGQDLAQVLPGVNGSGQRTGVSESSTMGELVVLRQPRLVPVLELEPWTFSTEGRPRPYESGDNSPEAQGRYWLDCLADSGITGL